MHFVFSYRLEIGWVKLCFTPASTGTKIHEEIKQL